MCYGCAVFARGTVGFDSALLVELRTSKYQRTFSLHPGFHFLISFFRFGKSGWYPVEQDLGSEVSFQRLFEKNFKLKNTYGRHLETNFSTLQIQRTDIFFSMRRVWN